MYMSNIDKLYCHLPWGRRSIIELFPFPYDKLNPMMIESKQKLLHWPAKVSLEELAAHFYALVMHNFQRYQSIFEGIFLYEDLIARPRAELERIFDLLNVDHNHLDKALDEMKQDSQNGVLVKRGVSKPVQLEAFKVDELFELLGVNLSYEMSIDEFRQHLKM